MSFKSIILSAAEIVATEDLKLVIDENRKPEGDHSRRYNKVLEEISVIVNDENCERRSFVVNLRKKGTRSSRHIQSS